MRQVDANLAHANRGARIMKHFSQLSDRIDNTRSCAWLYVDELMHRTLNDYTSILAIVRGATLNVSDEKARVALMEVDIRLKAAAATFRALGPPRGNTFRSLDLALADLCEAIADSTLMNRAITIRVDSHPVSVCGYRCWQISLIVAELISNAIRHAFNSGNGGSIVVELRNREGNIYCAVTDDGISNAVISPGRGSAIVDMLASELDGTIVRRFTGTGSKITLLVPQSQRSSQSEH